MADYFPALLYPLTMSGSHHALIIRIIAPNYAKNGANLRNQILTIKPEIKNNAPAVKIPPASKIMADNMTGDKKSENHGTNRHLKDNSTDEMVRREKQKMKLLKTLPVEIKPLSSPLP